MAVSHKVRRFVDEGGWIRRMFEAGIALKRQYGEDKVFDLSLGNPVVEPPDEFRQELRRLAENPTKGMHRYMPNAGYPETREAVAAGLKHETGIPFSMGDIVMTCGAAAALNVVLKTVLNPEDEVVLFAPYFVEYGYYADNHGGIPVAAPTDDTFQPDLAALEGLITPRTRAVILNSPNNPSGAVYGPERLKHLGDILRMKSGEFGTEIFLISDEPYRRIIYDGLAYPQVFPYYEASIAVTSHAKDLALPGERIGYIAVNPSYASKAELVDGLTFCNRILGFVNAPSADAARRPRSSGASAWTFTTTRGRETTSTVSSRRWATRSSNHRVHSICSPGLLWRMTQSSWKSCSAITSLLSQAGVSARRATSVSLTASRTSFWKEQWKVSAMLERPQGCRRSRTYGGIESSNRRAHPCVGPIRGRHQI